MTQDKEFAIQVVSRGSYMSDGYLVEIITFRANPAALNAWILSEMNNVRECYNTDAEWERHKAEYAEKRLKVKTQIINALGIDPRKGTVCITQALSEAFTVVYIQ
jgi:hypothetical protein